MTPHKSLDCVGLFCPMPIIKTKQELDAMKQGEILEILADDPAFEKDLPAWCKSSGEKFLELAKDGAIFKGYVMKV